jgi:hypothetical protein
MAGQQYSTGSLGGFLSQPYLTQKLRSVAQPMFRFRQFVDVDKLLSIWYTNIGGTGVLTSLYA